MSRGNRIEHTRRTIEDRLNNRIDRERATARNRLERLFRKQAAKSASTDTNLPVTAVATEETKPQC